MTREKAIDVLGQRETCRECVADCTCKECDEAFDIAIKALEQEPCDHYTEGYFKGYDDGQKGKLEQESCEDAISRSEAIRIASGYCHWSHIPEELAKLPSVKPKFTDEEIQTMQDLEQAEIEKAYKLGKAEGQESKDAISRQAAIRLAEQGQVQGFEWQFKQLIDLPSVSTEKVGEWIPIDPEQHLFQCSVCGSESTVDTVMYKPTWKYCPNCKAKMEVEE